MDSVRDTACAVGCPIRRSRDQRLLASPPGLSQRATSFIASQCQGIHQMPLLRLSASPNGKDHAAPRWQRREGRAGGSNRDERSATPDLAPICRQIRQTFSWRNSRSANEDTLGNRRALARMLAHAHSDATAAPASVTQLASLQLSINNAPRRPDLAKGACPKAIPVLLAALCARSGELACRRERLVWLRTPTLRAGVEVNGIEPMTSCLQSRRSPN
jgi:hypothetical protein